MRWIADSILIFGMGILLGIVGNALSPRGLELGRDYFPRFAKMVPPVPQAPIDPSVPSDEPPPSSGDGEGGVVEGALAAVEAELDDSVKKRLSEKGLTGIGFTQVEGLFRDPGYGEERIIFVDARDDRRYREGHIPSAYQLDHYHLDRYLDTVGFAAETAETIVVYCTGGQCEDSEFAALDLIEFGVAPDKIRVFVGGITEWKSRGMSFERGERLSGEIVENEPEP